MSEEPKVVCVFTKSGAGVWRSDGRQLLTWLGSGLPADPLTSADGVLAYALHRWPGCTVWATSKTQMKVTI